MFTTNIHDINTRREELHKQAAEYRLGQSLKKSNSRTTDVLAVMGKVLTETGQQIVKRYQPAH